MNRAMTEQRSRVDRQRVCVAVVIDDAEPLHRQRLTAPIAIAAAVESVGAARVVVVAPAALTSLVDGSGARFVPSDGTFARGLERALEHAPAPLLLLASANTAVLSGQIERLLADLRPDDLWVQGGVWPTDADTDPRPAHSGITAHAYVPAPGALVRVGRVRVGAAENLVDAVCTARSKGASVGTSTVEAVAAIGDEGTAVRVRRDVDRRVAILSPRGNSPIDDDGAVSSRRHRRQAIGAAVRGIGRLATVAWAVTILIASALTSASSAARVALLSPLVVAAAQQCLRSRSAGSLGRRVLGGCAMVDAATLALGSALVRSRRFATHVSADVRTGGRALLDRPITSAATLALEAALVVGSVSFATDRSLSPVERALALVTLAAAVVVLAPMLVVLGVVVRARPRRISSRREVDLPEFGGERAVVRDVSIRGVAIGCRGAVEVGTEMVARADDGTELPLRATRCSADGAGFIVGAEVSTDADASTLRWLEVNWLSATERAVDAAVSASAVPCPAPTTLPAGRRRLAAVPPIRFGGSRLIRVMTAGTLVALGVAVAPPYPASFAAPPPVSGPDATWWVQPFAGGYEVGNGLPAAQATFYFPSGATYDPAGNLYIADRSHHQIRKIAPDGTVTAFAGTGVLGFSGDGGPATAAELNVPYDVTWAGGALYIADTENHRVRKVSADGTISTVAGTDVNGTPRSGMAATSTPMGKPVGLDTDPDGRVVIARLNHQVLRLEPNGTINLLAGSASATSGFAGDGGPATAALFATIRDVAVGPDGSIVVLSNDRLRRFTPGGTITTIAGTGVAGFSGDGGPATSAHVNPTGIDIAPDGTIYVTDVATERVRRIGTDGVISTVAGTGVAGSSGDGAAATAARLNDPQSIVVDPAGTITVLDASNRRLRRFTVGGNIVAFAGVQGLRGRSSGLGGPAVDAGLANAEGLAVGPDGSVYIADRLTHQVKRVDPSGVITLFAGTGVAGGTGDGGLATEARINSPRDIAVGPDGSVYISEVNGHRVRKVSPSGVITTVAGTGTAGTTGDGGPATSARLNQPSGLAVAPDGTLYIADMTNHRIRAVSPAGIISTFAGPSGAVATGLSGDGGFRTTALFNVPNGLALAADGTLYIGDSANHRVRAVDPSGTVTTVAGSGSSAFSGDGGPATAAGMSNPASVAIAPDGALWIATANGRVRRVAPDGTVSTVFGASGTASWGTALPASAVAAGRPWDVAFTADGTPLISDPTLYTVVAMVPPPGPPTDVVVTDSTTTTATIGWSAPDAAPFTVNGYDVTATPAARVTVTGTTATLHDLRPNTTYAVSVSARVGRGATAVSAATVTTQPDPDAAGQTVVHVAGALRPDGPMPAVDAPLANALTGVAEDPSGAIYATTAWHQVWRIDPNGTAQVIAGAGPQGSGVAGFSGDGGPARTAMLNTPRGLVWSGGVLYVADAANNRVRAIAADGTISTVGGDGSTTWAGDGSLAVATGFNRPNDVAVDASGRLIVALGSGARIVRIEPDGTVTTLAGTGVVGNAGDGGPATSATIEPMGIAVAADGGILLAQLNYDRIRHVAPDGTISTVAGNGVSGRAGDGGPAMSAQLEYPWDVATFPDGSFTIADGNRIRLVAADGTITTVAGDGGGIPTALALDPLASSVALARNLITRADGSIVYTEMLPGRIVSLHNGVRTLIAGGGDSVLGTGGPAAQAVIGRSNTLALAGDGSLLFGQELGGTVQSIDPSGIITTVAGNGTLDGAPVDPAGVPALSHSFSTPIGMIADGDGGFYVGDWFRILHVDAGATLTQVAGGTWSSDPSVGLGGPAAAAPMGKVRSIAIAPDGALVYADGDQHAIKRIGLDGIVSLVAGTGFNGFNGDEIPAVEAAINEPSHLAFDDEGRLWFSDRQNHRLRMIDTGGIIHTMAGTGVAGVDADGLPATQSRLHEPYGFAFDGDTVVIANYRGNRISRLRADGTLVTIAGDGTMATTPESALPLGHPLDTTVSGPVAVVVLPSGSIVWTENLTMRIRAIPVAPAPPTSLTILSERGTTAVLDAGVALRPGEWLDVHVSPDASISTNGTRVTIDGLTPGEVAEVEVRVADRFSVSGPLTAAVSTTDGPVVSVIGASGVSSTRATVAADVTANALTTSVRATLHSAGDPANDGRSFTVTPGEVDGNAAVRVSASISGLRAGTSYTVRFEATNAIATTTSAPIAFTTASMPVTSTTVPVATTAAAPASPMASPTEPTTPPASSPRPPALPAVSEPKGTANPTPTPGGAPTSPTTTTVAPSRPTSTATGGPDSSAPPFAVDVVWASGSGAPNAATTAVLTVTGMVPETVLAVSIDGTEVELGAGRVGADGTLDLDLDLSGLQPGAYDVVVTATTPEGAVTKSVVQLVVNAPAAEPSAAASTTPRLDVAARTSSAPGRFVVVEVVLAVGLCGVLWWFGRRRRMTRG